MNTKYMVGLVLGTLLFATTGGPLAAQDLKDHLANAATKIKKALDEEKQDTVRVGEFIGNDHMTKGTGPRVQAGLIEALKTAGATINEKSRFKVSGTFEVVLPDDVDGKPQPLESITIRLDIRVQSGTKTPINYLYDFGHLPPTKDRSERFTAKDDLLDLFSLPIDQEKKGNANDEDWNRALPKQLGKPSAHILKSKVRLAADSPIAVEILSGPAGKDDSREPIDAFSKDQLPHVKLRLKDEYILRVHNDSKDQEYALRIAIDGVDQFQFFEGKTRPKTILVGPGKFVDVKGWRVDLQTVKAFLVGSLTDSALFKDAKLKGKVADYQTLAGSSDIGLIAVTFHRSWEYADEEGKISKRPEGARSAGTDLGRKIHSPAKSVMRDIGIPAGKIVIRYEKK